MVSWRVSTRVSLFLFALFCTAALQAATPDPLPRARPEAVGLSSSRLAQLTPVLQSYVDDKKLAGSVALVARRGKLVYFQAFGQRAREESSPMRTDTVF